MRLTKTILVLLLILATAGPAYSQRTAIDIFGPGQKKINLYTAKPTNMDGQAATAP
jgi:hypothetical protein